MGYPQGNPAIALEFITFIPHINGHGCEFKKNHLQFKELFSTGHA
jgi:hypothetical protein